MGSTNASGIPVVSKQNANVWNIGGSQVVSSGVAQITNNRKLRLHDTPLFARTTELGTQPSESGIQYSVMSMGTKQKTTESIHDTIIGLGGDTYRPTAAIEEELGLRSVSTRGTRNIGGRIVVSGESGIVSRNQNLFF